mmetsp:Transcript_11436/g.47588  ORF Transcript_11436/g.47588 Transcript_11436/m.47588 type:complete len:154 (+) Transcript_11436:417-878(+)
MDRLEKMQGRPAEIIPYSVMKGVLTDALPPSTPDMLKKNIYVHWVDRRTLERGGKPFLRFLQPPPDLNDQNPAVAFRQRDDFPLTSGRSRQYRQNTYENYKRLVALRLAFELSSISAKFKTPSRFCLILWFPNVGPTSTGCGRSWKRFILVRR